MYNNAITLVLLIQCQTFMKETEIPQKIVETRICHFLALDHGLFIIHGLAKFIDDTI